MEKAYSRINWKNGSRSTDTPLNETNMNLMDSAIDVIDGRVCQHDAQIQTLQGYETRAAQSAAEALQSAQDSEDSATDSANSATQSSGYANASALSATQSQNYSRDSEAWAKGTRNGTAVPSTDEAYHNNSKYWCEQAQQIVDEFGASNVDYDNSTSGLSATNVQSAIDEIDADKMTWGANSILGVKNIIPYPWYDTTKTASGITFTDNGDGTATINGTATADCEFVFVASANNYKPIAGTYRLTGIEGGSSTTYFIQYNSGAVTDYLYEGGKNYTVDGTKTIRISVRVKQGATVNNITVSPMFRLADDTDATFRPYAMTNKELTTPTFTQASTRANINSGETISTIMGKIKKFFADLKTVAFTGNASDVSFDNTGTTSSATTVQAGLKEALTNSAPTASDVPYTNTASGLSATDVQGAIDESLAENETAISSAAAWMVYENNKSPVRKYFVVSTNSADKWTYRGRGTTGRGNTDKVVVFVRAGGTWSQYGFVICAIGTTEESVTWANPTQYGDASVTSFKTKRGNTLYVGRNSGSWSGSGNIGVYGSATIDSSTYKLIPVPSVTSPFSEDAIARIAEDILVYDMAYTHLTQNTGEYAIANDEPTTTASQAYSVGQYLTQGGNLKKVTSAIASGESITSNNTSNTTVGEELRQINSDLTAKCPLWTTVATVSSVSASGATVNLPFLTTSGKRLRVIAYSSMWYVEMTSYGATTASVTRQGANGYPETTNTRGFIFTWENGNSQTCILKYFQNSQSTAFNAPLEIQVCKDY